MADLKGGCTLLRGELQWPDCRCDLTEVVKGKNWQGTVSLRSEIEPLRRTGYVLVLPGGARLRCTLRRTPEKWHPGATAFYYTECWPEEAE